MRLALTKCQYVQRSWRENRDSGDTSVAHIGRLRIRAQRCNDATEHVRARARARASTMCMCATCMFERASGADGVSLTQFDDSAASCEQRPPSILVLACANARASRESLSCPEPFESHRVLVLGARPDYSNISVSDYLRYFKDAILPSLFSIFKYISFFI